MKSYFRAGLIGFALSSPLVVAALAQDREPVHARCFERAVFVAGLEQRSGHRVSEDGKTVTFTAVAVGAPYRVVVRPPEGQRIKVASLEPNLFSMTFGECAVEPSPDPSPRPTPTPTPTSTPTISPRPTPTPTPTPTSTATPPPGKWPPPPPDTKAWLAPNCSALPDDPPGLLREGPGCDATGGSGTELIFVTNLNDSGPGSLRAAQDAVDSTHRRVACGTQYNSFFDGVQSFFGMDNGAGVELSGTLVLQTQIVLQKPRVTYDFSGCDITIKPAKEPMHTLLVSATHNLVIYSPPRFEGKFRPNDPTWKAVNGEGFLMLDGDGVGIKYPWDDWWDLQSPAMHGTVRSILIDRATAWKCGDDCLAEWEGVWDTSILRSWIHTSEHPSTRGAKGWPLPMDRWRFRNAWMYNVWGAFPDADGYHGNGERQPKPREDTLWWLDGRNIKVAWNSWPIMEWSNPLAKWVPGFAWSMGLNLSDDAPKENDFGWMIGGCYIGAPPIPGTPDHSNWGIIAGNSLSCDGCGNCGKALNDYAACNPKMATTHWYFEDNTGTDHKGRSTILEARVGAWPVGWVPEPIPFKWDPKKPWPQVLAEVGVVRRSAVEQALIDGIAAQLGKCVVVK